MKEAAKQIDLLINFQKAAHTELYEAAIHQSGQPLTLNAAEGLVKAIQPGDVVILSTGWCLPPRLGIDWLPRGENDGPSGTIALADALTDGLGAKVVFVQEDAMIPVLTKGCFASAIRVFSLDELKTMPREPNMLKRASICSFTLDSLAAEEAATRLIADLNPSALIAVEKAGRNEHDIYHASTGRDMSSTTSKVDYVFDAAREQGIFTAACLDGGNEIGGGNIIETLHAPTYHRTALRECICGCGGGAASTVSVDAVVTSTSSNIGAVAIAGVLSGLIRENASLLQDARTFRRVVEACVEGGALCGNRLIPSITIHQLPVDDWDIHILELIRSIINHAFQPVATTSMFRT
jgi:hypothetical protein